MDVSSAVEKFLKTIYNLELRHQKASGSNMASKLNISPAAITDMAIKLAGQGLINYQKHKSITLTPKGKKIALLASRKHRLWETFLHRTLNLNLDEIHVEAELIEGYTSEFLLGKIDEYLGFPEHDPHGDPIPDKKGVLPEEQAFFPISESSPGSYQIERLYFESDELNDFFTEYEFKVGDILELVLIFKMDNALLIKRNKVTMVISENIGSKILVSKLNE
ncbi:MAG: metal-dependent transcriptional regulator [Bacteroidetes bacterium HGW-Bacteroidetes-17]|nr:MAG: metal-dependent transcriptional regulator [Bacteroidetes bacterium HGW-Bacteroidetes-17]